METLNKRGRGLRVTIEKQIENGRKCFVETQVGVKRFCGDENWILKKDVPEKKIFEWKK
jgi:hypothetical protein